MGFLLLSASFHIDKNISLQYNGNRYFYALERRGQRHGEGNFNGSN